MLPAELPDELTDRAANLIMETVIVISDLLEERDIPPPLGQLALRTWLKIWEIKGLETDKGEDEVVKFMRDEWRKEVAAIKKRMIV
jgi:hypothetical protein